MKAPRELLMVLTAGLVALGLMAVTPAAAAVTSLDDTNVDSPAPPSSVQFAQLATDTVTYFEAGPIRTELIDKVRRAQDALHPPSPNQTPSPIRAYERLGGYMNQVQGLASTANGATDGGTVVLVDEVMALRSQISTAYPALHLAPGPTVRPGT
jgi:hypothetical protein